MLLLVQGPRKQCLLARVKWGWSCMANSIYNVWSVPDTHSHHLTPVIFCPFNLRCHCLIDLLHLLPITLCLLTPLAPATCPIEMLLGLQGHFSLWPHLISTSKIQSSRIQKAKLTDKYTSQTTMLFWLIILPRLMTCLSSLYFPTRKRGTITKWSHSSHKREC